MFFIRQGATHKVPIKNAVAVGDGFTPVNSLTLSGADSAKAILHDNATVVDISGYTWAAITGSDGDYFLTLQSAISNTVGHLSIKIVDSSLVLPIVADFTVIEEAVYDALYAASAPGYVAGATVNATQLAGQTITAAAGVTFPSSVASPTNITAGTITTVSGAVGSVTGNVGGNVAGSVGSVTGNVGGNVTGSVGSVVGSVGSISGITFPTNFAALGINASGHVIRVTLADTLTTYSGNTPQSGDAYARLGAPAGASVSADIAAKASQASVDDVPNNAEFVAAFPANFALLGVNGSGHISRVTLVDTVTTLTGHIGQTGDSFGRLGAPVGASISADIAAKPTAAQVLAAGDIDGYSLEEAAKLILAAAAGKVSGAGTGTVLLRAADDSKVRITATTDVDGNRSALTLDETG